MPAPVASGWSGRRVGLAPTGKAPPCHGARGKRAFAPDFCAKRPNRPFYRNYLPGVLRLKDTNIGLIGF